MSNQLNESIVVQIPSGGVLISIERVGSHDVNNSIVH